MNKKLKRSCQVKGCFSCKYPIYQPIVNVVCKNSKSILGQGDLPGIICEECQGRIKLKHLLTPENWDSLVQALSKHSAFINTPSYERSFLTFKLITLYTVH